MRVGSMTRKMSVSSSVKHRVNFRLLIFLSSTNQLADFVALSHFVAYCDVQLSCDVIMVRDAQATEDVTCARWSREEGKPFEGIQKALQRIF